MEAKADSLEANFQAIFPLRGTGQCAAGDTPRLNDPVHVARRPKSEYADHAASAYDLEAVPAAMTDQSRVYKILIVTQAFARDSRFAFGTTHHGTSPKDALGGLRPPD